MPEKYLANKTGKNPLLAGKRAKQEEDANHDLEPSEDLVSPVFPEDETEWFNLLLDLLIDPDFFEEEEE